MVVKNCAEKKGKSQLNKAATEKVCAENVAAQSLFAGF